MTVKPHYKLVRDKIPEILDSKGVTFHSSILNDEQFKRELIAKLNEEVLEFTGEPSLKELADIQQVILELSVALGYTENDLEKERWNKIDEAGGFNERIYLQTTDE